MGMWLFLFTEFLIFGGMFIAYFMYLLRYEKQFAHASHEGLSQITGTLNTLVLITSSLTVALAIGAIERGRRAAAMAFVGVTIALAVVFFVIKAGEWGGKFAHGIRPGTAEWTAMAAGERMFYTMYFTLTGMHGLHVLIGAGILMGCLWMIRSGAISQRRPIVLENTGLFWHLVDLIWIFLFPLFYLIGK